MKKTLLILAILPFLAAGCNFLDVVPEDTASVSDLYSSPMQAERTLNSVYGFFPHHIGYHTYPDFFQPAEDNTKGENRFNYNGRTDIMIETTVIASVEYQKIHSDNIKHVRDSLIMDGDYTEGNSTWENMRFHTKAVHSGKLWITYTLVFNKEFEGSLQRMISIIDQWNPTEC